jgi:hypothetical protein
VLLIHAGLREGGGRGREGREMESKRGVRKLREEGEQYADEGHITSYSGCTLICIVCVCSTDITKFSLHFHTLYAECKKKKK